MRIELTSDGASRPDAGFEAQGSHQAPSAPVTAVQSPESGVGALLHNAHEAGVAFGELTDGGEGAGRKSLGKVGEKRDRVGFGNGD